MWKMNTGLTKLLPDKVEGWTIVEKDKTFNRKNLYDYINGSAELYISYNFKKVVSRVYSAPGQPDIILDVFDMGSSTDAYGVFSHSKEVDDHTFGQDSQYNSGQLLFWKDRYLISVFASPETDISKNTIFRIAQLIDQAIKTKGPLPEILKLLPIEALIKESIRYFYHHIWLNSYYFIAQENILHIDENTDAVLAKYETGERKSLLLIIKYSDKEKSDLAYHDFVRYYIPELSSKSYVKIEDNTWTACRQIDNYLIMVFNAPEKSNAVILIQSVEKQLKKYFASRKYNNLREEKDNED
jgi:hypothetical protein